MNSERGPILFACVDQGLTRVHFMNSDKPFAIDAPFLLYQPRKFINEITDRAFTIGGPP